jgi:hypothetical protein
VKVWFFPWRVRNDDHSMSIAFGLTRPPRVLMIGWGWDRDLPLRPWPAVSRTPTPKGTPATCFAWFGFFITWAAIRRP